TCMPANYGYDSTGAPIHPAPGSATLDTAFGFPRAPAPIPRATGTPPDTGLYPSRQPPTLPAPSSTIIVPGAAPIPRASRPVRAPRDSARPPARDTVPRPERDSTRAPRDTA